MAVVIVQAGHVERTSGATGTAGLNSDPTEQVFSLAAAKACVRHLALAGHEGRVVLADVPSDAYRGDAFVAIHCDGSVNSAAHGASVGWRNTAGRAFAEAWKRAYSRAGWTGFRADNNTPALAGYYGVRNAVEVGNVTAFVAEAGFLTNPGDEARLSLPEGPERFAAAITEAVVEVFGGDGIGLSPEVVRGVVREETATVLDDQARRVHGIVSFERYLEVVLDALRR
jgi:N-acetylmuramoyl-L-alanine amidase